MSVEERELEVKAAHLVEWAENIAKKHLGSESYATTVLIAIFKVVESGFTVAEAKKEIESAYGVMV